MKKRIILFTALCMACILLAGCAASEPIGDPVLVNAMGRWEDKTYTNDYFDVSLTIPQQWSAFTDQQVQQLIAAENAAAAGGDPNLLKQAEQAKAWTASLFIASSREFGQQANASISMSAQMLGAFGSVFAGSEEDYLTLLLNAAKPANRKTDLAPITMIRLGNADFATTSFKIQLQDMEIDRHIYTKAAGGYLLIINAIHTDEAGKKDIDAMLQTLKIE